MIPAEHVVRRRLADGWRTEQKETYHLENLFQLMEVLASAVKEVDVRFAHDTKFLHPFPQVRGSCEGLRTVEIPCLKKQDDSTQIIRFPKK